MKETYTSNIDDPNIANERLKNKLDFLQRQSIKRQSYVKQIERNLKLCKQSIKTYASKQDPTSLLAKLQQQNSNLLQSIKKEYSNICKLNTLYLMECQLRIQQQKTYNQRIQQFQENIQQLRRYLHDKQQSFSSVVQKVKKYQQLLRNEQLSMYQRLINYSGVVKQDMNWNDIMKDLSQDRDAWKKQALEYRQKSKNLQVVLCGIKNYENVDIFKKYVSTLSEGSLNKISSSLNNNSSFGNQGNNQKQGNICANLSTNITYTQNKKLNIQPNIQLIRLMKKQKLNNKILEAALNEGIEKNIQLVEYNKRLIQNNSDLKDEIDSVIADMVIICDALVRYDENYRTKLRVLKHRSRCDLELPSYKEIIDKYKRNDIEEARQIVFTKMRKDAYQLSQYINLCNLHKTSQIRSYQSPRKMYKVDPNIEISLNQEQMEISQI